MKKNVILFLFFISPLISFAQLASVGVQYADARGTGNNIQFAANASFPVWHKKNMLNSFISSGIDYTGGSSPVAGLNIKPIQFTSFLSESLFNNHPYTILIGCDAGYIFNFKHGCNGVVISPNVYLDYKSFFLKTGYDFNVTAHKEQFFVRLGLNFGIGTFKMFSKTTIW